MAEPVEDWQPIAAAAPQDDWGPPPGAPPAVSPSLLSGIYPTFEPIMKAFGEGFREGYGPERLGLSYESTKWLSEHKIFGPAEGGYDNPFQAGNELVAQAVVGTGQLLFRGMSGMFRGLQAAGVEAGLAKDVVALPEAFFGSPHPLGIPKTFPETPRLPAPAEVDAAVLPPKLAQAQDLSVIGPPKPPVSEALAEKPARTMPARTPEGDVLRGHEPEGNPWQQRFNQFVDKLEAPDDVKQLIRDAAKDNGDFLPARQGDIPLGQVTGLAEAAGVDVTEINQKGIGRLLKNDGEVRTAMQLMLQVTENVTEAARNLKASDTPEAAIALQQAIMRRDLAVEQVVGLRAEWGRTGKVFQEFMRDVKDQETLSAFIKEKGTGRTPKDLREIADAVAGLNSPEQVARFMNDLRTPSAWDKYMFYWVNALISGPFTHAKYIGANAAFGIYEAAMVTPIAGAIGSARRAITGSTEGVYAGEAAARLWGLLAGTPDALRAAARAARENIQVPLPGEVAKNYNPVINQRPKPIGGLAGTIIGIPSRGATGIHSFFNFLGYRAELEAQAYRTAAKEGLSPTGDAFWRRRQEMVDNPTPEAMEASIKNGYHLTFLSEQGKFGKALSQFANTRLPLPGGGEWQPFKLILPFTHIPGNILRASLEQTPAAFLDETMRADLLGKHGAVAQDTAVARIVAGGAISAMVVNWALNDTVTGYGPTDPKERLIWLRTHEPYSVRLGGWWVSYNKFGPIGNLMGIIANLAEVGPKVHEEEYAEAAGKIIKATGRLIEDEIGMQGLHNVLQALEEPDRKAGRWLSGQIISNLPFSSALRQTASFNDPILREAKEFVDQLRYSTPWSRQDLLPKRDWLGQPLDNPAYHSILRTKAVNADPIDLEISQLRGFRPAPPQDRIGGVKLPPKLYDEYQATAGAMTRATLEKMVNSPGWSNMPPFVREQAIHGVVESMRRSAGILMQIRHPEIMEQGIKDRTDRINGVKPTKLKD